MVKNHNQATATAININSRLRNYNSNGLLKAITTNHFMKSLLTVIVKNKKRRPRFINKKEIKNLRRSSAGQSAFIKAKYSYRKYKKIPTIQKYP